MAESENVAPDVAPASIPYIYFNGFQLGSSLSDMSVLVLLDGYPQAKLMMSFTTAKTLAENLTAAVRNFEEATGHTLMNMDDVRQGLAQGEVSENPESRN